jgi:8-oxo-dGTP diphosphatase
MKKCWIALLFCFLGCIDALAMDFQLYDISTSNQYAVFTQRPSPFQAKFEAVGCFLEYNDQVVLLKRQPHKIEGNTWGIPGGKIELNETPREAVIRETREETGLNIDEENYLKAVGSHYICLPKFNFVFHMFRFCFSERPEIKISDEEHVEAGWFTADEALEMPLITGEIESFVQYKKLRLNL